MKNLLDVFWRFCNYIVGEIVCISSGYFSYLLKYLDICSRSKNLVYSFHFHIKLSLG
jgi:hypothetical protein